MPGMQGLFIATSKIQIFYISNPILMPISTHFIQLSYFRCWSP